MYNGIDLSHKIEFSGIKMRKTHFLSNYGILTTLSLGQNCIFSNAFFINTYCFFLYSCIL